MVYTLGKIIGRGSDGVVYELKEDEKSNKVIKFIQGENFGIKNYIEYYILYNLNPDYITSALNIEIEDSGLLKIVQERALMDLKKYITVKKLTLKEKKEIIFKIVESVNYLHSKHILHGDLKPSNILVFDEKKIKLSDFNLSKLIISDSTENKKFYTLNFRPPEVQEGKIYLKSDIWALGCTIYEIYYGTSYFQQGVNKNFFHLKSSEEFLEKNKVFNDLVEKMTEKEIESRFSITDVLNHDFFNYKKEKKFFEKKELDKDFLQKNIDFYKITPKKNKIIFNSKILNNNHKLIDNSYRKIEKEICKNKFNFYLY